MKSVSLSSSGCLGEQRRRKEVDKRGAGSCYCSNQILQCVSNDWSQQLRVKRQERSRTLNVCLCLNGSSNKTPGSFTQWLEPYKTLLNALSGGWLHSGAGLQGRAGNASGTSWDNSDTGVSQARWKGLVKAAASGAVFPNILESAHFNLAQARARFQIAGVGSLAGHFTAKLEKKIGLLWLTLLVT